MSEDAPLLTVVVETNGEPDREATTYRRLLSARLRYPDRVALEFVADPLTTPAIADICSRLPSKYVVFVRLAHQVSVRYLPVMLESLKSRTAYLAEPIVYTGPIPERPASTHIDDDYFYSRDTAPYGVVFHTKCLHGMLEAVADIDVAALYLSFRLYWSIAKVKPLPVGYSMASDTKAAIGIRLAPAVHRLLPLIPSKSTEMRLYILRLLAIHLRGLRGEAKISVSLAHIRDVVREYGLGAEVERVAVQQPFEAAWIRWLADPASGPHLYKQLSGKDAYLVFRQGGPEGPEDVPLYQIHFPDAVVWIAKTYLDKELRPSYGKPEVYDFYARPITPESTLLFFDRPLQADDNAEHLYEYFRRNHPEFTNLRFALSRKSPDWDRLTAKGFNLVPIFSEEFYEDFLRSDAVVSSQIYNIRYKGKNLSNSRFVYLQHGVQLNDMTDWVVSKYFDVFVATGEVEAEYLRGVAPVETLNSGLPRMESLRRQDVGARRRLVFMPTWRFNLHQSSSEHFKKSAYFRSIDDLLTDQTLLEFLERTDRELQVKLHPNVQKRASSFRFSERVVLCESGYREALESAEMVLTDYSSVVLDAAFIGTPVAYYQWDAASFFVEQPYERRLDYQSDGLGPVFFKKEDVVHHIVTEEYLSPDDRFAHRRKRFFEGVDPEGINATIVERMLAL